MVGSVLIDRFIAEKDFDDTSSFALFSTSQSGEEVHLFPDRSHRLQDAYDLNALAQMDILVSCQGGEYTKKVHPQLRSKGWVGFWIDAASTLRLDEKSVIVLDPVNREMIDRKLEQGVKDFIGSNCTVAIMVMAIHGLFKENLIEWVSNMTYQSASGVGAKGIEEMIQQMNILSHVGRKSPGESILALERRLTETMNDSSFPQEKLKTALAGNIIPWVDRRMDNGQSREEWKGFKETNKIYGFNPPIPIDGTCVRVGVTRCHSEGLTIKLKKNLPIETIEEKIRSAHEWVHWVPNEGDITVQKLTPSKISGKLSIGVGRVRKMEMGGEYLNVFCIGDQLLWGAAEPLRRTILILMGLLK
ncbi:aspartate-semialdehyde dehydrogenase 1-like [Ylistrum balloti]|uniref:aspartate-semialdehyde dehydrogenase 1-like n=1 Tax=Ylistrum balloti TaxID=509963 RepID=UPI002905E311|nr:aspartate-semialdehyde dehydrogenase 1-like [Ylistrum balloti]